MHRSPFLCFRGKIGGYSILQHFAYSRCLGMSFELLTTTVSPRALLVFVTAVFRSSHWKCITGVKNWGKMGGVVIVFWPLLNSFLLFGPQTTVQNFVKVEHRQTDKDDGDFIICSMLCYSNGTEKFVVFHPAIGCAYNILIVCKYVECVLWMWHIKAVLYGHSKVIWRMTRAVVCRRLCLGV